MLPHGTGRSVQKAVFTQGANVEAAKAAGADLVGMEDLAEQIKKGEMNLMLLLSRVVGQLGQILGPRGLMPNPKVGTVTPNVAEAVKMLSPVKSVNAMIKTVLFILQSVKQISLLNN